MDNEKMPSRCLNRVTLIGNLTRDPELRYTPAGMAVTSFGLATNRTWVTKQGERKEDAQFHRIVAWNKLAELCSQLLNKGRRIYVEGRIQYREFSDNDNNKRQITEIVIDDMIILDNKGGNYHDNDQDAGGDFTTEDITIGEETNLDVVLPTDELDTVIETVNNEPEGKNEKKKEESEDMPF